VVGHGANQISKGKGGVYEKEKKKKAATKFTRETKNWRDEARILAKQKKGVRRTGEREEALKKTTASGKARGKKANHIG